MTTQWMKEGPMSQKTHEDRALMEFHRNAKKGEYVMSESLMNPAVYYHQFTAEEAIASELRDIAHRLDYVMAHAAGKFDTCELHEQSQAITQLSELITALSSKA